MIACRAISAPARPAIHEEFHLVSSSSTSSSPVSHDAATEALALARAAVSAATEAARLSLAEGVLRLARNAVDRAPQKGRGIITGIQRRPGTIESSRLSESEAGVSTSNVGQLTMQVPDIVKPATSPTRQARLLWPGRRKTVIHESTSSRKQLPVAEAVVVRSKKKELRKSGLRGVLDRRSPALTSEGNSKNVAGKSAKLDNPQLGDPFFALFGASGSSRLLSAAEEIQLSKGVQVRQRQVQGRDNASMLPSPTVGPLLEYMGLNLCSSYALFLDVVLRG